MLDEGHAKQAQASSDCKTTRCQSSPNGPLTANTVRQIRRHKARDDTEDAEQHL
jgi:hypothetical protein